MTAFRTLSLLTAAAGASAGCGGEGGGEDLGAAPGAYQPDYKTSSAFFTRMSQPADSGSVHGNVRIWYSVNIQSLPVDGPFVVPEGTVAIKDEYDSSGNAFIKVVMVKKAAGYDPEHQDWYYEARNPDDTLASDPTPGTPGLCINCHQQAENTDYLYGIGITN